MVTNLIIISSSFHARGSSTHQVYAIPVPLGRLPQLTFPSDDFRFLVSIVLVGDS